ncbi:DUF2269 family protein [Deinococcus pimensis]|uniref:DUF2269 family protein n=1 Tax=Deinococcus pimensis TaxID=309888 RepID=UPI0004853A6B|nr:DUF2269 family protein [Deinococcus pimensis]
MKLLVLIHVLSAVIGIGPTFFSAALLRGRPSSAALRHNLALFSTLSFFPKIGGTLTVLSGLALIWRGQYGSVTQLWLLGSLVLYVLIQVVVLGYVVPRVGRLTAWASGPQGRDASVMPGEQAALLGGIHRAHLVVGALGLALFALMILKPS